MFVFQIYVRMWQTDLCVVEMLPDSNFRSRVPSARADVIAGSSRFR